MHIFQSILNPASDLQAALSDLAAHQPHLVLAYGAPAFFADAGLADALRAQLPEAIHAGCSGAAAIVGKSVDEDCCVLTAVRFDTASTSAASTELDSMPDSFDAGVRLGRQFAPDGLRAVLLFAPGLAINGSALIAGLASVLGPEVGISGGLASDGVDFARTWTLGPGGAQQRQVVGVGLYGTSLTLGYGSYGGWTPFGPARKVTRSEGNVLYELDGKRALDLYKLYLGPYAEELPGSGLLFPFEMLGAGHQPSGVFRTILGVNEESGSLTLAGDIDPDGYLRLMHATTDKLIDGAEVAARNANATRPGPTLALLVSCIGRRLVMGDRVDEEVEAVARIAGRGATLAGFYANGEIGAAASGHCAYLHNQTMTVTILGED